ncbi:hypothetical protein ACTXT7_011325 [Hymenolepis weldensis]
MLLLKYLPDLLLQMSLKAPPIAIIVQVATGKYENDESQALYETSTLKVVPARPVCEPAVLIQQPTPKSYLHNHKTTLSQRSYLMDNKYNEHEEVGLAKSIYYSNVTLSKVVAQSASEAKEKATFSPHQNPIFCPQTKVSWTQIDLILPDSVQQRPYPGGFIFRVA